VQCSKKNRGRKIDWIALWVYAIQFTMKEKYSGVVRCNGKEQGDKDGLGCILGVVKFGLL